MFLSNQGNSSLPAGITLIIMSRSFVVSSCCHFSSILPPLPVRLHVSLYRWRNSGERKWCCVDWIWQEARDRNRSSLNLFVNTLSWHVIELITIVGKILRPGEKPWDYHTTLVSAGCSFLPIPVTSSFHQINYQIVGDSTDFKRKWLTGSSGDVFYLIILTLSIF